MSTFGSIEKVFTTQLDTTSSSTGEEGTMIVLDVGLVVEGSDMLGTRTLDLRNPVPISRPLPPLRQEIRQQHVDRTSRIDPTRNCCVVTMSASTPARDNTAGYSYSRCVDIRLPDNR